eukprot:gene13410-19261_t
MRSIKALGSNSFSTCRPTSPLAALRFSTQPKQLAVRPNLTKLRAKGDAEDRASDMKTEGKDGSSPSNSRNKNDESYPESSSFIKKDKEVDEAVDENLRQIWDDMKVKMKERMPAEESALIESVTYEELMEPGNNVFKRLADQQLGPSLDAMGITDESPFDFFITLVSAGLLIQFVSVGMLFYSSELIGHMDAGQALRVASGLGAGYLLRPFFRTEQLLGRMYNGLLQNMGVEPMFSNPDPKLVQQTLNGLGILIAVLFFAPRALWGWDAETCIQFVSPVPFGIFLSDLTYVSALYLKLNSMEEK